MNDQHLPDDLTAEGRRIPILFATRADNGDLHIWCPFCGRFHIHGNLTPDDPIGAADGHRAAHCVAEDSPYLASGYVIVEHDGLPPEPVRVYPVKYTRDGRIVSGLLDARRRARGSRR